MSSAIYIHTWFPEPIPQRFGNCADGSAGVDSPTVWSGSVRIWGHLHEQDESHRWWRSSSILRRVSPTTFVTHYGTLVSLLGSMYTPYARKFNLSDQILHAFCDGFPEDWLSQLCQEPHPFYSTSPYVLKHSLDHPKTIVDAVKPVHEPSDVTNYPSPIKNVTRQVRKMNDTAIESSSTVPSKSPSASTSIALDKVAPTRLRRLRSHRKSTPKTSSGSPIREQAQRPQPASNTRSRSKGGSKSQRQSRCQPQRKPEKTIHRVRRNVRAPSLVPPSSKNLKINPSSKMSSRPPEPSTSTIPAVKQAMLSKGIPKSKKLKRTRSNSKKDKNGIMPRESGSVEDPNVILDENKAEPKGGAKRVRKRVAFATAVTNYDSPFRGKSMSKEEDASIFVGVGGRWSQEQREAFERQRNLVAANMPDYWERVASGVPQKSAEECQSLWLSNWVSPPPHGPQRQPRVATPEVVMQVRKAAKQKRSRETGKFRSNVRRLAEVVARDINDDALEPHIVTPTHLPGAVDVLALVGQGDGAGRVIMDGTPGSEVRERRARTDRQAELVTPEILARGKRLGFQESDHYVSLFKRRIGSVAPCEPIMKKEREKKVSVAKTVKWNKNTTSRPRTDGLYEGGIGSCNFDDDDAIGSGEEVDSEEESERDLEIDFD